MAGGVVFPASVGYRNIIVSCAPTAISDGRIHCPAIPPAHSDVHRYTDRVTVPSLQQVVQTLAQEEGFALAGVAPIRLEDDAALSETLPELNTLETWIVEGRAGEMEYLKRRDSAGRLLRTSVTVPFPWVRSVVVCAVNYHCEQPYSLDAPADEQPAGWIARYAWSGKPAPAAADPDRLAPTDYHAVIRERLERLRAAMAGTLGEFQARCFVDTGPLVERVYAKYAGLGWLGKNTCLIHPRVGSWTFLGVILTSLELPAAERAALVPDRCGSCTRCIEACPTQALTPYSMDASRCIAYLTIEKRGALPEDLAALAGRQVFGCDICQEVCPWNRRAPFGEWPELQPRPELVNPALDWLETLDAATFRTLFRDSPLERTRFAGLTRNISNARRNFERGPEAAREQGKTGSPPQEQGGPISGG
jgi:epoxyqueuosine reductase